MHLTKIETVSRHLHVVLQFAQVHPFVRHAAFAEVAGLPLAEKVARLRSGTELRQRLLAERQWQPGAPWVQPRTTATGEDFHQWMDFAMTRCVASLSDMREPKIEIIALLAHCQMFLLIANDILA